MRTRVAAIVLRRTRQQRAQHAYARPPSFLRFAARPLIFASGVTVAAYGGAGLLRQARAKRRRAERSTRFGSSAWRFPRGMHSAHPMLSAVLTSCENTANSPAFVGLGPLLGFNTLVFAGWQMATSGGPKLRAFMERHFLHQAFSPRLAPMVLACFSHSTFTHFAFNMFALNSFGKWVSAQLGPENLVATYIAGGVWSSFGSMCFKYATMRANPSLGASGSVIVLAASMAFVNPDARFALIFLPMFTFKAIHGIGAMAAFDSAGLLFRWSFLDHAAHLSAVGVAYGLTMLGGYRIAIEFQRSVVRAAEGGAAGRW